VTETELWIQHARDYLEAARRAGDDAVASRLKTELDRIGLARVQAELGCGDDCVECSWGTLGGQPLGSEPCRAAVLQQGIAGLHELGGRDASTRQEAARLLEVLESLPPRLK